MKTIYTIIQDSKKTFFSFGFWACVVLTFLLCFTSTVYTDLQTGKEYNGFDAIFNLDKEFMLKHGEFFWYNVFSGCIGQYLSMILPIITAFPFIPNFCAERNSGLIRFTISRTGKFRYCFSKFITAFMGGGTAVLFGTLLFGGACYIFFLKPDDLSQIIETSGFTPDHYNITALSVWHTLLGTFLFSAMSAIPAFLLSAFIKNRYIITCVPFMAIYMYSTFMLKIMYDSRDNYVFKQKYFFLFHDSLLNYWNAGDGINKLIAINLLLIIGSFTIFCIVMFKKSDVGQ